MTSIHTWSTTATDNDDADSAINWLELQDPDTVNNSARAMMGRVAEWRDDTSVMRASSGAADAYVITAASSPAALVDGMEFVFKAHQTNVGASTLKVNSFGAKPLRAKSGANLSPGDIQTGAPIIAYYNLAADEFLIANSGFFANALFPSLVSTYALNSLVPVGGVIAWAHPTIPAGWLECNGQSLAVLDYPKLASTIGYAYGGSGLNFNLPDYRGEFLRGLDNGAGRDPNAGARTNRGDGATGDAVGTKQGHEYFSHGHLATTTTSVSIGGVGDHTHQQTTDGYDQDRGTAVGSNAPGTTAARGVVASSANTLGGGAHSHSASATSTTLTVNNGGSETRPRNVNVIYIMFALPAAALAEMQGLTGLPYVYDSGITAVDPGAGRLAWNNATTLSATELYVSETGPNSEAFGPILATWDDVGTTTRGYLHITKVGTPTTFAYFSIASAETDNGAWKQWTITAIGSGGTFTDGDNVNVMFSPAAQTGQPWAGNLTVAGLAALGVVATGTGGYATDGRKNGEGAASGTGVQVFYDSSNWIAVDTGATVAA